MGWQTFQFGRLYLDDEPQHVPVKPWQKKGDIPNYRAKQSIRIGDTYGDEVITWIKPDGMNLLVADRILVKRISWNDINAAGFVDGKVVDIDGCRYKCRLLQLGENVLDENEWSSIAAATTDDYKVWHDDTMCFWGSDVAAAGSMYRSCRGRGASMGSFHYEAAHERKFAIGFRPALEPLPSFSPSDKKVTLDGQEFGVTQIQGSDGAAFYPQLRPSRSYIFQEIPDGSEVKMYTLLCDGAPVRQDTRLPDVSHKRGTKFTLTDEFFGEEFLISWIVSNGLAVASRSILGGLTSEILQDEGYMMIGR